MFIYILGFSGIVNKIIEWLILEIIKINALIKVFAFEYNLKYNGDIEDCL